MLTVRKSARFGFTLIELLVVIAIIAILAGMLFPVFAGAKEKARQVTCINNQRQLAIAIQIFTQDHQKYPGTDWYATIAINEPKVFVCPSKTDQQYGYGMNSYLQNVKADTISNTSTLICTADADATSTTAIDFTRHNKGGIVSHVDGSVAWYPTLKVGNLGHGVTGTGTTGSTSAGYYGGNGNAGHFACGPFHLQPTMVIDGIPSLLQPANFVSYPAGADAIPSAQFLVAGPYGDGNGDGTNGDTKSQVHIDYIGEIPLIQSSADAAPMPGILAPRSNMIDTPTSAADLAIAGGSPNVFTHWTVPTVDVTGWVKMILPQNYNCNFQNRTTYGVLYIFSPVKQVVNIDWHTDDDGIIWLNEGPTQNCAIPIGVNDSPAGGNDNEKLLTKVTLLPGISYMLVKDVNFAAGMKFYVDFQGAPQGLAFSSSLN